MRVSWCCAKHWKQLKHLQSWSWDVCFWKQENEIHKKQHKLDVWQWTGNGISDDGAVALGSVLKSRHSSLTSINLYGLHQSRIILVWYLWIKDGLLHVFWIKTANKISECGVKALCDALAKNKKLKVLDIGGKVAWSLCPRLSGWKVMQWLWTKTGNAIGDESALVFAGMLRQNTTLEVLFLEGLFFCLLKMSVKVKWICVWWTDNEISDDGAMELAEALEHNTTLTAFYFDGLPQKHVSLVSLCSVLFSRIVLFRQ